MVRAGLVQVVLARPEVADDARHAAGERGARLALGVVREIAVDADVEVRVHRAGEHQQAAGVEDLGRFGGRDRVGQRDDAATAHADVAAEGAEVRDHDAATEDRQVVPRHGQDYIRRASGWPDVRLFPLTFDRISLIPENVGMP